MKESARCFRGRRCTLSEPDENYCVGDVEGFLSDFFTFLCFFAFSAFSVFSGWEGGACANVPPTMASARAAAIQILRVMFVVSFLSRSGFGPPLE